MSVIALCWLLMLVYVVVRTIRSRASSVGLPIAFILSMTFLYCGAFVYAIPSYTPQRAGSQLQAYFYAWNFSDKTVLAGAGLSLLGVVGFTLGAALLPSFLERARALPDPRLFLENVRDTRRPLMLALGVASVAGFALTGLSIPVPMVDAVLLVCRTLAIAAVCLGAVLSQGVNWRAAAGWYAISLVIPLFYLVIWGFTSYGFITLIILGAFWLTVLARRQIGLARIVGIGAVVTYACLCLFVAWMSFREDIRAVVWSNASLSKRVETISNSFAHTKLLTPTDFESLDWLTVRLNQGLLVGKAVERHAVASDLRLNGGSIIISAAAVVPRALWPGKPTLSQSDFVTRHTGVVFSKSANFGSGPIFELFVNFGATGIFLGMLLLGAIVRALDKAAALGLREGRLIDFVRAFTVGLALVSPLSTIFFMVNTALISWIVLTLLKLALGRRVPATHIESHPGWPARSSQDRAMEHR
ncbi:hypothetical protein [Caulobacter sp. NIBR1757]|uniref:hypothetical protein n=1 Tax=Caulobacter sp. NIBR1757 TaxID=3016000 RepID=UPI0022F04030|nr:hypothetical protein [Caulobacter sp. NIBR1757]